MIHIQLNQQYPFPAPLADGVRAIFLTSNANTLQIKLTQPTGDEIKDIKKGDIRCGIKYNKGNILLLFQFLRHNKKTLAFEFDCVFDARIIHQDDLNLHLIDNTNKRLVIDIHLVDENNIVKALRSVTMPNSQSIHFMQYVCEQLNIEQDDIRDSQIIKNWNNQSISKLIKTTEMKKLGV